MNYCLQKFTTHQFTYFIYYLFQDKFKYTKNDVNPTSTSEKLQAKQFLFTLFKVFSIGDSYKFDATQETRLI